MKFLRILVSLRHLAIIGSYAGASTGLFWSVVVSIFSLDQRFDGIEMMISLLIPGIISVLAWRITTIRLWIVTLVSHLTLLLPLFGLGIGGANVIQMTIAGVIGGFCWTVPIILYYFGHGLLRKQDDSSLRKAGRAR